MLFVILCSSSSRSQMRMTVRDSKSVCLLSVDLISENILNQVYFSSLENCLCGYHLLLLGFCLMLVRVAFDNGHKQWNTRHVSERTSKMSKSE